eukprot:TRINITY_DN6307_c0_g1_i1.p1 TRINITY_DN6307_c0_g1~~TRINITY_DN6307_c0_g1_i1.p1  ORF type:complete len:317 (+),score=49.47 TRINITY_DN6307_c0_g1_i1:45-995(+)
MAAPRFPDASGLLPWLGVLDVLRVRRVNTTWQDAAAAELACRSSWVYTFDELAPSPPSANDGIEGIAKWKVYNSGEKIVFNSKGGPKGFSLVGVQGLLPRVDFLPLCMPRTEVWAEVYRVEVVFRPTESCDVLLQGLQWGTLGETGFGVRITRLDADKEAYTLELVQVGAGGDAHPFWSTNVVGTIPRGYLRLDLYYSAAQDTQGGLRVALTEHDPAEPPSPPRAAWSDRTLSARPAPLFEWTLPVAKHLPTLPKAPCLALASTHKLYVTHVSVLGGCDAIPVPPRSSPAPPAPPAKPGGKDAGPKDAKKKKKKKK